jgi:hypothetical protein
MARQLSEVIVEAENQATDHNNSDAKMASIDLDNVYSKTMSEFNRIFPEAGTRTSTKKQGSSQKSIKTENECRFCRTNTQNLPLIEHSIVPDSVAEEVGLFDIGTIALCFSCHRALHRWNAHNVSWFKYDSETKRLNAKPLPEVAKEYASACTSFINNLS